MKTFCVVRTLTVCIHLDFYANFKLKQLAMNSPQLLAVAGHDLSRSAKVINNRQRAASIAGTGQTTRPEFNFCRRARLRYGCGFGLPETRYVRRKGRGRSAPTG